MRQSSPRRLAPWKHSVSKQPVIGLRNLNHCRLSYLLVILTPSFLPSFCTTSSPKQRSHLHCCLTGSSLLDTTFALEAHNCPERRLASAVCLETNKPANNTTQSSGPRGCRRQSPLSSPRAGSYHPVKLSRASLPARRSSSVVSVDTPLSRTTQKLSGDFRKLSDMLCPAHA